MPASDTRPLPGAPSPHDGESWTSYITRLAHQYRCTPTDIRRHLGTRSTGIAITDDDARHVASLLNLHPDQIHVLHLTHLAGTALPDTIPADGRGRGPWTWLTGPRTCPACLHDNGWAPLSWQLPWITTCTRHATYLTDSNYPQAPAMPAPVGALARTRHFEMLLAGGTVTQLGHDLAGNDAFDLWRAAIRLATHCRQLVGTPATSHDVDTALATVEPLVMADTLEAGAAIIDGWCQTAGIAQPYRSALPSPTHRLLAQCIAAATRTPPARSRQRSAVTAQQAATDWLNSLDITPTPERINRLRPYAHRYPPGSPERRIADALIRGDRTPSAAAIRAARWA